MAAQVTEVNKALLSVSKLASKGCRAVFEEGNSYIENKASGDWIPLEERNGMCFIKMWSSDDTSQVKSNVLVKC